ncbi:MAG: DUF4197 domain-containing protein [Saezia sp.]
MDSYQLQRRRLILLCSSVFLLCSQEQAFAATITQITQNEAATGLKSLLNQAASIAIKQLGVTGGFNNDHRIHIRLPSQLDSASSLLRKIGMSKQFDQLETSMNNAAEQAVAVAQPILTKAITNMSFQDAKSIITDGDKAGTAYLERSSRKSLFTQFRPIVKNIVSKTAVSTQYNALVSRASTFGITDKDFSMETYVTDKALDGLFFVMGEKETYIRNHPAEAAGSVAQKILDVLLK